MIGREYLYRVNQLLNEALPSGTWVDRKTSFDFLYEGAKDFVKETRCLNDSQDITTVANQTDYLLNPNFLEILSTKGFRDEDKVLKYYDGTNYYWLTWKPYPELFYANNTTSRLIPSNFSIMDAPVPTPINGTITTADAHSYGLSVLTDTSQSFASPTVYPGDDIFNRTTGDIGKVISIGSTTQLNTAMFDISGRASAYADWTLGDSYTIHPRPRYKVVIDPPPSTTGHVITIPYIKAPAPVYDDASMYSFAVDYEEALVRYAVWLYKYRDTSRGNKEDTLYKMYDSMVRKARNNYNVMTGRHTVQVSWKR